MRVIVLDCYSRMGLAVINALDRSYDLIGGAAGNAARRHSWADRRLRSPRLSELFRYPHAHDERGFQEAMLTACRRYEPDAIFPGSTATAYALSRMKDLGSAPCARLVVEKYSRFRQLADKWLLYELCSRLDIPTPRTALASDGLLESLENVSMPCVVKPRLAEASRGVRFARTCEELAAILADLPVVGATPDVGAPYIVQEQIRGEIASVGGCAVRGRAISLMTQRRILTRFEFGGTAIVSRTTYEPELMEYAERILAELEWSGPLLLEFIASEDGRYHLIDGNPRIWASVDLAVACGMNVCQQAVDIFVGDIEPDVVPSYRIGLTMRWLSPQSVRRCFWQPRRPSAVWKRFSSLLLPRRPSTTITNLRRGNIRHLIGMMVDSSGA